MPPQKWPNGYRERMSLIGPHRQILRCGGGEAATQKIVLKHAGLVRKPFDQCKRTAIALAADLNKHGIGAKIIRLSGLNVDASDADPRWKEMSPFYYTHYVVAVGHKVYDLTRKQFFPSASQPYDGELLEYYKEWDQVSEYHTASDAFNPSEERDEHGRWTAGAAESVLHEHGHVTDIGQLSPKAKQHLNSLVKSGHAAKDEDPMWSGNHGRWSLLKPLPGYVKDMADAYDPDEARGEHGEWTAGGAPLAKLEQQHKDGLNGLVVEVGAWFSGTFMQRKGLVPSARPKLMAAMKTLAVAYPPKVPATLYRVARIDNKELASGKMAASDQPIESWTTDPKIAQKFYEQIYSDQKRFQVKGQSWAIISVKSKDITPLATHDTAMRFLRDVNVHYDELARNGVKLYPRGILHEEMHQLGAKFLENQHEVTCAAPAHVSAHVEKVFTTGVKDFDPNEARNERGEWTLGGGGPHGETWQSVANAAVAAWRADPANKRVAARTVALVKDIDAAMAEASYQSR
jgi:hypothetical protein